MMDDKSTLSRRSALLGLTGLTACSMIPGRAAFAAQLQPVVVELFTSQGCSSCPPADALVLDLAKRPDIVALSYNVDYWDYIGWKDTFAKPEFGARARSYVAALKVESPYTPQMVIDGVIDVAGSRTSQVNGHLQAQRARIATAPRLAVALTLKDGMIEASIPGGTPPSSPATIWMMETIAQATVTIGAGENRGVNLTCANVVRRMTKVGTWTGSAEKLRFPVSQFAQSGTNGGALLVQTGNAGPILGAAQIKL